MPRIPRPRIPRSPFSPLRELVREGRHQIEKAGEGIRSIADDLHGGEREPPVALGEIKPTSILAPEEAAKGTACLPCCRDHLSTSSSALSEGLRFARDKGVKDPEAVRRIRIALDELNVMERIDLAPEEIIKLKGAEKELANWTLKSSRDIRHAITAIKDVDSMEGAAVKTSTITEEFMTRLLAIPEDECVTCGEIRESIRQFIEQRRGER